MDDKNIKERARDLVSTSVDDLQSSLYFYNGDNPVHAQIIEHAFQICNCRGEKTKAKLLNSKLRKLKKDAPSALTGTSSILKSIKMEEEKRGA